MTDHILGTKFNYQNLVPVGTGQKKGYLPQKIANCRKRRLLGKFWLMYLESLFPYHLATISKKIGRKLNL